MEKLEHLHKKYEDIFNIFGLSLNNCLLDLKEYTLVPNQKPKQINDNFLIYQILYKKNDLSAQIGRYSKNKINFNINCPLFRDLYYMCLFANEMNHPSIINFNGFSPIDFKGNYIPVIITEKIINGSLYDFLKHEKEMKPQNSEWDLTKQMINIYGIAAAMAYLHSKNILYRNLSTKSILLDQSLYPKLFNFGSSCYIKENRREINGEGTQFYYSKKNDLDSFGFVAYNILTNDNSLEDKSFYSRYSKFNEKIPKCYKDLIQEIGSVNSDNCAPFDEIVDELMSPKFVDIIKEENKKREYIDYICLFQSKIKTSKKFLNINNYQIINEIDRNDLYKDLKIKEKSTGIIFNAKSFVKTNSDLKDEYYKQMIIVDYRSKLDYPSILKYIGYSPFNILHEQYLTIINERSNESLKNILELEKQGISPSEWNLTKKMINIYGIASGMKYLHSKDIIHQNLTTNNIFEDDNYYPKIGGFDYFFKFNKTSQKHLEPEIISQMNYYKSSDVYLYSNLIYEIFTNEPAFEIQKSKQDDSEEIDKEQYPIFDDRIPKIYQELIERCLSNNPNERPTFSDIIYQMRTNPEFIIPGINKDEYEKYIEYLDFENKNKYNKLYQQNKIINNLEIDSYEEMTKIYETEEYKISKIRNKTTNKIYMAKIFNKEIDEFSENEKTSLLNNIDIISKLKHPSIPNFIGFSHFDFKKYWRPVIVTEITSNYTLHDFIIQETNKKTRNSKWNYAKKLINIFGIASAMKYLHSKNIVHQNLSPDKIFLDESLYPKLYDFSCSNEFPKTDDINDIGIFYEMEKLKKYDVFTFSFIAFEILTLKIQYPKKIKFFEDSSLYLNQNFRPKFNISTPKCCKNLIQRCWSIDQDDRPTFDEIVSKLKTDEFINIFDSECEKKEYLDYIILIESQNQSTNKFLNMHKSAIIDQQLKIQKKSTGELFYAKPFKDKNPEKLKSKLINLDEILTKIDHPSILKYICYIIFDYANEKYSSIINENENDNLKNILELEKQGISPSEWNLTKKIINIYGIASGMKYLHSKDIIHQNLTTNNIFEDDNYYPKIGGFDDLLKLNKTSQKVLEPEIISQTKNNKSSDVYSYSNLIYEIFTKESTFEIHNKEQHPIFDDRIPKIYQELIERCLSNNPNERPTFSDIVYQMRTNPEFIIPGINKDEYEKYIEYLDFENKNKYNKLYQQNKIINNLEIDSYEEMTKIYETEEYKISKIRNKTTNKIYMAKIFNKGFEQFSLDKYEKQMKLDEILSDIDHPSIIKYIGYSLFNFIYDPNLTIITEFAQYSLESILELEKQGISPSEWNLTKKMINIYGIASGMKYLHSKDIIHRNLTTNNIFEDDNYYPKIGGFDYILNINEKQQVIDSKFSAPEVIKDKKYSKFSDVFSFAVIIKEIFDNDILIPKFIEQLIISCMLSDPLKRPTFDIIVNILEKNEEIITKEVDEDEYKEYISIFKQQTEIIDEIFYQQIDEITYVDINNYEKLDRIGRGAFNNVFRVKEKGTEKLFAAKIKNSDDEITEEQNAHLVREVKIMFKLNHPTIIKIYGYSPVNFNHKPRPTLILELGKGTLRDVLKLESQGTSPEQWDSTKKHINIYGIALGMKHIHSYNIVHRDLKPENILEDDYLFPKITDFGLSKILHKDSQNQSFESNKGLKGTLLYMSPEMVKDGMYSKAGDVYSFGIMIYEIITGETPYKDMNKFQIMNSIMSGEKPKFSYPIPECYKNLIEKCLSLDIKKRPQFSQIVDLLKTEEFLKECIDESNFWNYVDYCDNYNNDDDNEENSLISNNFEKIETQLKVKNDITDFVVPPEVQIIDLSGFEKRDKLGSGGFAKVYKIIAKSTNETFAAKVLKDEITDLKSKDLINFMRELEIISKLNHASIMKFIGYSHNDFKNKTKPVIISEIVSNGSLSGILDLERRGCKVEGWDDTKKLINIYGIASAMKYLHSKSFIHRDIKPENILLDEHLFPKISDFGLAKVYSEKICEIGSNILGTPHYIAPEIWKYSEYTKASDVYAFGLTVYEIMTNERALNEIKQQYKLCYEVAINNYRPKFKIQIPQSYKELIEICWSPNPYARPTFERIIDILKTDPNFITKSVDFEEFVSYTKYINESFIQETDEKQNGKTLYNKEPNKYFVPKVIEKIKEYTIKTFNNVIETFVSNHSISQFLLDLNNYELKKLIRKSEFSKVYEVVQKSTGKSYSARISNIDMTQFRKEDMVSISFDFNLISELKHPSILLFVGFSPLSFKNEPKPVIITELSSSKTLADILKMERKNLQIPDWNETKKLINIYGIASAMKYLHSNGVIHRNLNPNNIIMDEKMQPKLSDFGMCTHLLMMNSIAFQTTSRMERSSIYSAPETLTTQECTKASDVYSFSMIVYEIVTKEKPIVNSNIYDGILNISEKRPEFKSSIPDSYKNLIESCWSKNPGERPSFNMIVDYLENDANIITDEINKEEYLNYIQLLSHFK